MECPECGYDMVVGDIETYYDYNTGSRVQMWNAKCLECGKIIVCKE